MTATAITDLSGTAWIFAGQAELSSAVPLHLSLDTETCMFRCPNGQIHSKIRLELNHCLDTL